MLNDFKDNLVNFAAPADLEAINVNTDAKTRGSYQISSIYLTLSFINFKNIYIKLNLINSMEFKFSYFKISNFVYLIQTCLKTTE